MIMAERINARVTLHVEVFDAKELWQHAYGTYEEQNGTADQGDFEEMYGTEDDPDIGECIRMIFDPGESPPCLQIEDSSVEVTLVLLENRYPLFIADRGAPGIISAEPKGAHHPEYGDALDMIEPDTERVFARSQECLDHHSNPAQWIESVRARMMKRL
jgi:hypothetical protein